MTRSLLVLAFALVAPTAGAADDSHYATKADAKADRRTPGRPAVSPQPRDPDAGGEEGEKSLRQGLEVVAAHLNVIAGQNTQLLALFARLAEGAAA